MEPTFCIKNTSKTLVLVGNKCQQGVLLLRALHPFEEEIFYETNIICWTKEGQCAEVLVKDISGRRSGEMFVGSTGNMVTDAFEGRNNLASVVYTADKKFQLQKKSGLLGREKPSADIF
jgi:hypothetical protein